ncbi:hypothetical protein Clacol_008432 [Clathrus columnatus]|uniref:Uncharacterized protein n=1 Tax=Clathrus columnatus TaxID=1419009 RepID=A0AAV5AMN7_9AGAM|nr:hypothetical protein Clacol_008432 [Clathrus columnatus]
MTVTGLTTINLSTLTPFQQVILYALMAMGNITIVSWIMVLVRKRFFRIKCEYTASKSKRSRKKTPQFRSHAAFLSAISSPVAVSPLNEAVPGSIPVTNDAATLKPSFIDSVNHPQTKENRSSSQHNTQFTDAMHSSPVVEDLELPRSSPDSSRPTLEFRIPTMASARRRLTTIAESVPYGSRPITTIPGHHIGSRHIQKRFLASKFSNFGGFPGPMDLLRHLFPKTYRKLERKLTLPRTTTLVSSQFDGAGHGIQRAHWLPFDGLAVRRNSFFQTDTLSTDQLEKIGGVEYRALNFLSYLVIFVKFSPLQDEPELKTYFKYFIGTQMFCYILIAPWLDSTGRYNSVFQSQFRLVAKPWFALFQTMSAYTGGGLTLVDTITLIHVQRNGTISKGLFYDMFVSSGFISKLINSTRFSWNGICDSSWEPGPYLCLASQAYFLSYASDLVPCGVPRIIQSLPFGNRFLAGLFQGLAARASGFSIVAVANLAPAVQFLYVVMMYIAVYPVALTIRSTNVYEEQSLGVFEHPEEDEEPELSGTRGERVGKYLNWHLRRQLSIDIWWIVWGVFFVCIIERANLLDENKKWFDVFRVIFEVVSAFGGIGLSLGIPTENFSFSGALRPLSKLVIIVVMIRGRHRGLPLAIDRSILLPVELAVQPTEHDASA